MKAETKKQRVGPPFKEYIDKRSAVPIMLPNAHILKIGKDSIRLLCQELIECEYNRLKAIDENHKSRKTNKPKTQIA